VERAFAILADVSQRHTRWSIVYDQTDRTVHFRTDTHAAMRTLALRSLRFDCASGTRGVDVNARLSGDLAARLSPFSAADNHTLVDASFRDFSGTRGTPAAEIARTAAHPFTAACQPQD
jgi:hypothetical protein